MPFPANVYRIFIPSPGDVDAERRVIRQVVAEWNPTHAEDRGLVLMPIGWETDSSPLMGDHPQAILNPQLLAKCDLLVGVFWNRLGTPTETAASGTVEEIETHMAAGKPAMLYFSDAPVNLSRLDPKQRAALGKFKASCGPRGLYESFTSEEDFRTKFRRQLAQTVIEQFEGVEVSAEDGSSEWNGRRGIAGLVARLSDKAKDALVKAVDNEEGSILFVTTFGGSQVQVGREVLLPINNQKPRQVAEWKAALQELIDEGLADGFLDSTCHLTVTALRFEVAEVIADGQKAIPDQITRCRSTPPSPRSAGASGGPAPEFSPPDSHNAHNWDLTLRPDFWMPFRTGSCLRASAP